DADERLVRAADEGRQLFDPGVLLVDRIFRAGRDPGVAFVRRGGKPAAMRLEVPEPQAGKQRREHLAVAALDLREAADDVVALEQADVHFRKWNDFGRVKASRPRRDNVTPRPESLTPVQASAGSR